jgi:hypothetical protein
MEEYWTACTQTQPASPTTPQSPTDQPELFISDFDRHRQQLLAQGSNEDWQLELQQYLQSMPADVTRYTDIVTWWSVSVRCAFYVPLY